MHLNAHGEAGVSDTYHKYQRSVSLTFLEGKGVYIPPLITNWPTFRTNGQKHADLYRTLNCTSPNQRECSTYAKRRFEGSMGVQTVVSDSNP
jgi:hypothetical protein